MASLWVFYFLIPFLGHSQNKQIVYDFANLPQTLLLNPGAEVTNKWHVGVPVVSHFSVNGGFTGFSTYDIFADNGREIEADFKLLTKARKSQKISDTNTVIGKHIFLPPTKTKEIINNGDKKFKDELYFDENFFMYLENDDLCKRLIDHNENIYVVPKSKIIFWIGRLN